MNNKVFYLVLSIVSAIFIVSSEFYENGILRILANIGYSSLAASLMALFVDWNSDRREQRQIQQTRREFFKEINREYLNLIGHLLWLDERLNDSKFDWSFPDEEYFTLSYMLVIGANYTSEEVTYSEAKLRLKKRKNKYSLDGQRKMTPIELEHLQKMFSIIAKKSDRLILLLSKLEDKRLTVASLGLLSLDQCQKIFDKFSIAHTLMSKKSKNYSMAVKCLMDSYEVIRKASEFNDSVTIGPNGIVPVSEI